MVVGESIIVVDRRIIIIGYLDLTSVESRAGASSSEGFGRSRTCQTGRTGEDIPERELSVGSSFRGITVVTGPSSITIIGVRGLTGWAWRGWIRPGRSYLWGIVIGVFILPVVLASEAYPGGSTFLTFPAY